MFEEARQVTIPLHVLLQWDDEGNDRQLALDLFDAFGSKEKTLHANMGGHTGVPQFAGGGRGPVLRPAPELVARRLARRLPGVPCTADMTRRVRVRVAEEVEQRDARGAELAVKLVVTPLLIGGASLAGQRWGHQVGGWLVALP